MRNTVLILVSLLTACGGESFTAGAVTPILSDSGSEMSDLDSGSEANADILVEASAEAAVEAAPEATLDAPPQDSASDSADAGHEVACVPNPVACDGIDCGETSDGCTTVVCGSCHSTYDTCGGGGIPHRCGCSPVRQFDAAAVALACGASQCGTAPDGCGGSVNCGFCSAPELPTISNGVCKCQVTNSDCKTPPVTTPSIAVWCINTTRPVARDSCNVVEPGPCVGDECSCILATTGKQCSFQSDCASVTHDGVTYTSGFACLGMVCRPSAPIYCCPK